MAPLRVCWLIKGLGPGGAERLLVTLAASLDRAAVQPEVVYTRPDKQHLVGPLEALGVPCRLLPAARSPRWPAALRRVLLGGGYDVVHVHSPALAPPARLIVRTARRPRPALVYTEHNIWSNYGLVTRLANALTYPLDERRVCVSAGVLESMPGPWRRRTRVLLNGVPVADLAARRAERAAARSSLGVGDDEVLVVTVANLRAAKNYPGLLRAARQVVDAGAPVCFVAVGQGPLAGELGALKDQLGLGNRFRFLGYVEDPVPVMAAADIFTLASWQEGHSIALLEAMALGLPVVVTAVGGNVEVVRPSDGFLVPAGDDRALAERLLELVGDVDLRARLGAGAAARAHDYDITVMARQLTELYRAAVGPTTPGT